jgi:biopolymer transport protein ExbD
MRALASVCVGLLALLACHDRSSGGAPAGEPSAGSPAPATMPGALSVGPVPAEVALPTTQSTTAAPADLTILFVSSKRMSLGLQGPPLAAPPTDANDWPKGFDATYKRGSRADFFLLPLGNALAAAYPDDAAVPEIGIAADRQISYRMLSEIVFTLGQNRVKRLDLLARSGTALRSLPITLPGRGEWAPPISREALQKLLGLDATAPSGRPAASGAPTGAGDAGPSPFLAPTVIVGAEGFILSVNGRRLTSGCQDAGAGVTIPRTAGALDYAALTKCAASIKSSLPHDANASRVTLVAEAATDVQTVAASMDALRGGDVPIFSEVMLGVPK